MNNISIRERTVDDAEMFYGFIMKLDTEAEYMLFEKGERIITPEIIRSNTENIIKDGDACYVALDGNIIAGYLIAVREKYIRTKHVAGIIIGILEEYCGNGIGYEMFNHLFKWADTNGVKRLELLVIAENIRAINLYKKLGFRIEGVRENATYKDGRYYDEYYMAKML
ncbi:MAG TPA: GNAT family N-acetyltransferase [Clostridiales bacterium]|nr:GNAT family N-acetyltransferase [Clostridiales bacterium]